MFIVVSKTTRRLIMQDTLLEKHSVEEILARHMYEDFEIIEILQEIQRMEGYLSEKNLVLTSKRLRIPLSRVYGIATFYKNFTLVPRGKYTLQVCTGAGCLAKGGMKILDRLRNTLQVKVGGTTSDRMFNLETVRCVGCCGRAPVVVAAGKIVSGVDFGEILEAIENLRKRGRDEIAQPARS